MKRKKKYLHLHTRLDEYDVEVLRRGFALAKAKSHGNRISVADYTRAALHRYAQQLEQGGHDETRAA
jgi:hypothetical protein